MCGKHCKTVLELHSQTELQHSAEQLKQLRLDLKHQMSPNSLQECSDPKSVFVPLLLGEVKVSTEVDNEVNLLKAKSVGRSPT